MADITIYGASDDCIELEGAIRDEHYVQDGNVIRLTSPDGEVMDVRIEYGRHEWDIRVDHRTGDLAPNWPVHLAHRDDGGDHADDPALIIGAPAGTTHQIITKD